MSKVDVDQIRTGLDIGDPIVLEDVGGSPAMPAVDGSQLTGIIATGTTSVIKDLVSIKKPGCPELVFRRCGGVIFLRKDC